MMARSIALDRPLEGLPRSAAALWRSYPREVVGAALLGLVSVAAIVTSIVQPDRSPQHEQVAPPAPPAMAVRPLAPEQALKMNAEIPVTGGPNPAAAPFAFKGDAEARNQALNCLASAIYYEAGNQDEIGERAVAQVVLNRVRHPAFPSTVCGVVYQGSTKLTGCQFTFTCDGSLNRRPDADGWKRALDVAQAALAGSVYGPVGWATHYHADYVVPYWASTMAKNAVIGAHLFYRWSGSWGQPAVFTRVYAGHEPNAASLRSAALAAVHISPAQPGTIASAIKNIPGAEPLKLAPSMRGNKRVAVRFNLVARTASDQAPHEDYSKRFAASDNLKWSLSNDSVGDNQQPLGRTTSSSASTGAPR